VAGSRAAGSRAAAHWIARRSARAVGCNVSEPGASSRSSTSDRYDSAGADTDATGTSASFDAVAAVTSSGGIDSDSGSDGDSDSDSSDSGATKAGVVTRGRPADSNVRRWPVLVTRRQIWGTTIHHGRWTKAAPQKPACG
jgi:hypothetical protein